MENILAGVEISGKLFLLELRRLLREDPLNPGGGIFLMRGSQCFPAFLAVANHPGPSIAEDEADSFGFADRARTRTFRMLLFFRRIVHGFLGGWEMGFDIQVRPVSSYRSVSVFQQVG